MMVLFKLPSTRILVEPELSRGARLSRWFEGNQISVACACMRIGRACTNGPATVDTGTLIRTSRPAPGVASI